MPLLKVARRPSAAQVSFQYEESPPQPSSVIESAARAAHRAVAKNSLDITQLPFYQTSKALDWFCGAEVGTTMESFGIVEASTSQRLRAITRGSQTLLECSYGSDGQLAKAHYFNGEVVAYEGDGTARTRRVRTSSGRQIDIKSHADDLIESITYDTDSSFQYRYDCDNNITELVFPDGVKSVRTFGPSGDVATMRCAGISSELQWTSPGYLNSYKIRNGREEFQFQADARQHVCDLTSIDSQADCLLPILHPLGAWRLNGTRLLEMLTPWGDRSHIRATASGRPTTEWSSSGQQSYSYDNNGAIESILHPNGLLSVVHRIEDGRRALVVSPTGVTTLELDPKGRVVCAVNHNGVSTRLKYSHDGSLKRIDRGSELIGILDADEFAWVMAPGSYFCEMNRSANGQLSRLFARGLRKNNARRIQSLLDFLWQWIGLRMSISIATGRSLQ